MNKMTFLLPEDVSREIEERTEHSRDKTRVVRHALSRYFTLLQRARADLRAQFTDQECALILDAMNGIIVETRIRGFLAMEVGEAIGLDGLAKKLGVDGEVLLAKLRSLTPLSEITIIDACERWWNRVAHGEQPEFGELLE